MSDEKAADYIDGIAVHWYWDTMFPPSLLDYTHDNYPNKFLISTEASVGKLHFYYGNEQLLNKKN